MAKIKKETKIKESPKQKVNQIKNKPAFKPKVLEKIDKSENSNDLIEKNVDAKNKKINSKAAFNPKVLKKIGKSEDSNGLIGKNVSKVKKIKNKAVLKPKVLQKIVKSENLNGLIEENVDTKVKKIKMKPALKPKALKKIVKSENLNDSIEGNVDTFQQEYFENLNVDLDQLRRGASALLEYRQKYKAKNLFKEQENIFLSITSIRIPNCPTRKFRIKLKHPFISSDNEICLIVPDLKRGRRIDHEDTIVHYTNLLKSNNIDFINRIIPIRQLRVEYDQFELKRRLCAFFDFFLVDGRISGHVLHLLGKNFTEKRKQPVPVNLLAKDLYNALNKAVRKTDLTIHPKGNSYIVQIGHTNMLAEDIVDNLKIVINTLVTSFPGNWENIRALHLKTDKSIAIPVYLTLRNSNEVQIPVIKRPKLAEPVTDELTTRRHSVTVYADGTVVLNTPNKIEKKTNLKPLKRLETGTKNNKVKFHKKNKKETNPKSSKHLKTGTKKNKEKSHPIKKQKNNVN